MGLKLRLNFPALLIIIGLTHHLVAQRGHSLELLDFVHLGQLTAAEMVHQLLIDNVWSGHDVLEEIGRPVRLKLLLLGLPVPVFHSSNCR